MHFNENIMKKSLLQIKLIIILLCTFMNTSCILGAIAGGAAIGITTSIVLYDKRDINTIVNDKSISHQVTLRINSDSKLKHQAHIVINTYNGWVLLAGQTPNKQLRSKAQSLAKSVTGIKRLYNEINVAPNSSLKQHFIDSWITTKIKTKLLNKNKFSMGSISITTENSTVFFMGMVTKSQAKIIADVASQISEVKKVIKIFQYER